MKPAWPRRSASAPPPKYPLMMHRAIRWNSSTRRPPHQSYATFCALWCRGAGIPLGSPSRNRASGSIRRPTTARPPPNRIRIPGAVRVPSPRRGSPSSRLQRGREDPWPLRNVTPPTARRLHAEGVRCCKRCTRRTCSSGSRRHLTRTRTPPAASDRNIRIGRRRRWIWEDHFMDRSRSFKMAAPCFAVFVWPYIMETDFEILITLLPTAAAVVVVKSVNAQSIYRNRKKKLFSFQRVNRDGQQNGSCSANSYGFHWITRLLLHSG